MTTVVSILIVLAFACIAVVGALGIYGLVRNVRENGWKTRGFDTAGYLWTDERKRDGRRGVGEVPKYRNSEGES